MNNDSTTSTFVADMVQCRLQRKSFMVLVHRENMVAAAAIVSSRVAMRFERSCLRVISSASFK